MWLAKLHSKFITPAVVKTRSTGLFFTQTMNYRVYRRKYVDPDILTERAEFLAKMKEYRIRNREEFKAIQGEVNNNFMLENKERLIRAHRRDGDKERTSIIKIAMHTKNLITHLKKREIEQEEKDKWKAINEMKKLRERQMYLQAIQIDHEAPTPPPAVIDHEQYFERLQNLALLAEKGMYEEMEKVLKNQEIVDEKNIYLQPLFRNIKKSIRFITKTEEAELTHRLKIEGKEDQIPAELQKLREKDRDPFVMIKKLERHITSLFHLMVNWLQYVEIIYLPESRIQALKHLRLHTEDRFKEEEKEQKEYLKKILKSEQKEEDLKYQTVEEGLTSDTAESETEDNKRKQEHKNIKDAKEEISEKTVGDEDSILGQLIADEENKQTSENNVSNFAHDKSPEFDKSRRNEISSDYAIGTAEMESFKSKIQEKGNIKREKVDDEGSAEVGNLDMYGIQAEFKEEDENAKSLKEEEQKQYIAEQLLDLSHTIKNEYINETVISRPDSGIDPFNPPSEFSEYISKYENNGNISVSLVLEHYYKRLGDLQSELTTQANKNQENLKEIQYELETIEKLKKLLDYMSRIKIIDPQVLAEIYDIYRYKI